MLNIDNFLNFMKKRIKKIYFLYMLINIIFLVVNIIQSNFKLHVIITELGKLFLSAFFLQTLTVKFWDIYNSPAWFISCIFWLYLITPFFLHLFYLKRKTSFFILLSFLYYIVLAGEMIILYYLSSKNVINYDVCKIIIYSTPYMRAFYYLIGMNLGYIVINLNDKIKSSTLTEVISVIMMLSVYLSCIHIEKRTYIIYLVYIPVISLCLLTFGKYWGGRYRDF